MIVESKLEGILYRILKGRLRFSRDGLILFIYEPSIDILTDSYDVYQDQLKNGYMSGVYTESELIEVLVDNDIWNPLDDIKIEEVKKELEDIKVECFNNFFDKRKLKQLKYKLFKRQEHVLELMTKKASMNHLTCAGLAENARNLHIISKTVFFPDGTPYDWVKFDYSDILVHCQENTITSAQLREICRNDPWRSMWQISKKRNGPIDKSIVDYTRDQLSLCSYSSMYDNVYEHPECPCEDIINDDDCLDGWFISQRRKSDLEKKSKSSTSVITNSKIKNSKEIFMMADNKESASDILNLNNEHAKSIIKQRQQVMDSKESVKDNEFMDVKIDLQMQKNNALSQKMRGK